MATDVVLPPDAPSIADDASIDSDIEYIDWPEPPAGGGSSDRGSTPSDASVSRHFTRPETRGPRRLSLTRRGRAATTGRAPALIGGFDQTGPLVTPISAERQRRADRESRRPTPPATSTAALDARRRTRRGYIPPAPTARPITDVHPGRAGDDITVTPARQPWRFDDHGRLDGVGGVRPSGRPWPTKRSTFTETGNAYSGDNHNDSVVQTAKYSINEKLKARASKLGLPVADYDNTLSMAIRRMRGGRHQFIGFLQLAAEGGDEEAKKFVTAFRELTRWQQPQVSLDLLCQTVGVSRVGLLKTAVAIGFENQVDVARLVEVASLPTLVDTAIQSAERLDSAIGQRDRAAILQQHGLMPQPKGAVINVSASAQAAAAAVVDPSVPSFLDDVNVVAGTRDTIQQQIVEAEVEDG